MQIFSHIFAYMKTLNKYELVDSLGSSFLGLQLHQLLSIINNQGDVLLQQQNIDIPSRTASTIMLIKNNDSMSVTELGAALDMSHQLVGHRIKLLKSKNIIIETKGQQDKRKSVFKLTSYGKEIALKLEQITKQVEKAYDNLFDEIGANVFEIVKNTKGALSNKTILQRL